MKIVTPKEITAQEKRAFSEGVSERDLMENAGIQVAHYTHHLIEQNQLNPKVILLVGKGNNGGDAFVAGCHLMAQGYQVHAVQSGNSISNLCMIQRKRFQQEGGLLLTFEELEDQIGTYGVILDGLFGTGFTGTIEGELKKIVQLANQSLIPIIAIDIPSGLNGETGEVQGVCIQATVTLTLTAPKIGFFLGQGWNCIGTLETVSIGLPEKYYDDLEPVAYLLEKRQLHHLLPPIVRNRHKFERGHAVIAAGNREMMGAAFLASLGAFRGGSGYVHLLIRPGMEEGFHNLPELILVPIQVDFINEGSASLVGPGFGRTDADQELLYELIRNATSPLVIDADGLYLLAQEEIPLPPKVLLTPHHGEMARLLNLEHPVFNMPFIQLCQSYSRKNNVHILLKGAPTLYLSPHMDVPIIIPFGDPGMATAGSGDLLSGILVALLSQKLEIGDAALLGASLHGLAGMMAAEKYTSYSMKALDIAKYIPQAFKAVLDAKDC